MSKPYDIFVSYATEDEQYARDLTNSLKHHGLETWFAPIEIRVGERLLDSINAGLIASKYGLVVLSSAYINKSWTKYELDVLHRQHVEKDKRIFPIWCGVTRDEIADWNPGLSGIVALNGTEGTSSIASKVAKEVSKNASIRGVTPCYENPQWRFLQGRGELLTNSQEGPAFNIFEAAAFPESHFPLFIYDRLYTRGDIVREVAKVLGFRPNDTFRLSEERRTDLLALCKDYGYDIKAPDFDPATIG